MDLGIYQPFAIALALGLLIGLQREWHGTNVAGIRTMPLVTLLGAMVGTVGGEQLAWISAAGLLSVAILLVVANVSVMREGSGASGLTTEIAVVLMYVIGVALAVGFQAQAIVTAGVAAVLLHWKQPLHGFVDRIGKKDFRGLMHLVLIAMVILPLLPNETFGPFDVLNPYKIWLMVVLIVGISLVGYVCYKLLGTRIGGILGGIFGGMISSTATTVSYARQARSDASISALAALVIVIASTIVNVRVLIEVGVVAPALLPMATPPLAILSLVMVLECVVLYLLGRHDDASLPEQENPAQLKPAIIFALLYAVILFVVAWAKEQFGNQALYVIAVISGLTDVDAITLSTANLFQDGRVSREVAWRVILIATLANLVFKGGAVAFLGSRRLLVHVLVLFGISLACGIALLMFWPDISIPIPEYLVPQATAESK